jgi:curved DNA-binding protein
MTDSQPFVDYYDALQVSPSCDAKILEAAYHYLAKLYHPDHSETADTAKFKEVVEAYRVLRNPDQRAEYDILYVQNYPKGNPEFKTGLEFVPELSSALVDADDHAKILLFLYEKRRENAQNAGVVGFYLQEMLNCSDEHFDFHKWYLKEKGFVVLTEHGTLAITVQGVDHVISLSRHSKAEKLLIGQSGHSPI